MNVSRSKMPPTAWMRWPWLAVDLPEYPRDRRTIAYHEAGHAVLQCLMGLPMTRAEVHEEPRTDGQAGIVRMNKESIKASAAQVADNAIPQAMLERASIDIATMFVSGVMAELKLHGLELTGWLRLDWQDFKHARTVLCEAFGWDRPLYYCQCLATAILTEHWPWVTAVAERMLAAGAVSAQEVADLFPAGAEKEADL